MATIQALLQNKDLGIIFILNLEHMAGIKPEIILIIFPQMSVHLTTEPLSPFTMVDKMRKSNQELVTISIKI